jgi:hypothetical protein
LCDADEESINDMLNEELGIDSDDEMMIWKLNEKLRVKNRATKCRKVSVRVKQVLLGVDGCNDVTMGNKKPKAYAFIKNGGPQFNLLPDAQPKDYFILFFSDK